MNRRAIARRLGWWLGWGAAGAVIGTFLTPTEAGVLLCCAAIGYTVWLYSRASE